MKDTQMPKNKAGRGNDDRKTKSNKAGINQSTEQYGK